MEIVHTLFSIFWFVFSCLLTGFVLWRKLRHERVDSEEKVFDTIIAACMGSIVIGRIAYILFHINTYGGDVAKWLAVTQFPGNIGVVSLVAGLVLFWKLLKNTWKDSIELVDYVSIALSFLLFILSIGTLLSQGITLFQTTFIQSVSIVPLLDVRTFIVSVLYVIAYGCLHLFLSKVEKNYRTLLWYRAKRRSAQTGFVVACFLIGYGITGFLLSWFMPMNMIVLGIGIDPFVKLLVVLSGFVILYVRSGRSFLHQT